MFRNDRKGFVPAYYEGITLGIAQNLEKYEARPELILERIVPGHTIPAFFARSMRQAL